MSRWVVDTCVIIDILSGDGDFSGRGGLITRNEVDFKSLYPNLTIFYPISLVS